MKKTSSILAATAFSLVIASPALAVWDPAFSRSYDRQLRDAGQGIAETDAGSAIATNDSGNSVGIDRAVESKDSHRDN